MNILIGLLIVVEILVSVLLTLIILVQPSKSGGGLGGALGGGGMSEQLFGARTGNVLTKATIVFASVFLINTIALAVLYSRDSQYSVPALPPAPGMAAQVDTETQPDVATPVETATEEAAATTAESATEEVEAAE
ncbi:preprotein translocase subunit SecG [Kiritimatiellaeota bacterium B1221]|nr:preprotein translocase subunit SecG [Kiritimatiellaeota bacterium B1221]